MLEIYIEPRRTVNIKQAVLDAIGSGEYETLHSDIRDCFTDEQIEEIEEVLESGDIEETIDDIITEWAGDDLDDLLETIENYFADASIQVYFEEDDDLVEDGDDDYDDALDEIEEDAVEEDDDHDREEHDEGEEEGDEAY